MLEKNFSSFLHMKQPKYVVLINALHCNCTVPSQGCDKVSYFGGKCKKIARDTWKAYGNVPPAFSSLAFRPTPRNIQEWLNGALERVVTLLFD